MANAPQRVDLVGLRFKYQFQVSLSTFFFIQSDHWVDEYFFFLYTVAVNLNNIPNFWNVDKLVH